jgi:hypothetical protein
MNYLKWLRLLNVPLKELCVVFIIWEHIIVVFSFDALFGLTWRMLTPCLTLTSRHKPLWSFGFYLVIPFYTLVNNVLSLCMIMAVIALLVGRSQSFASLHFILRGNASRASNSQKPKFFRCVHHIYLLAICYFKHNISCFYLSFKLNFLCYVKISQ